MTYIDDIAMQIARRVDDPEPDPVDMPLYRGYAVLALSVGDRVTRENVHDAWSAWMSGINPEHSSLVWFDELDAETQDFDQPYVAAIRAVVWQIRAEGAAPVEDKWPSMAELRDASLDLRLDPIRKQLDDLSERVSDEIRAEAQREAER